MERKSTAKAQLVGVALFGIAFVSVGVAKYGLLLAYLNVSGYLAIFISSLVTYQVVSRFDTYLRRRSTEQGKGVGKLRVLRHALAFCTFSALFYVLFFVQPDRLAIAYVKGIPVAALYSCSNEPVAPEVERLAREIFQLRSSDSFTCTTGSSFNE